MQAVQDRGSIPYIVWEPYDASQPGENGYNWGNNPQGTTEGWSHWREAKDIFGLWDGRGNFNNYETLVSLADLPIIIGEFASAEPGQE